MDKKVKEILDRYRRAIEEDSNIDKGIKRLDVDLLSQKKKFEELKAELSSGKRGINRLKTSQKVKQKRKKELKEDIQFQQGVLYIESIQKRKMELLFKRKRNHKLELLLRNEIFQNEANQLLKQVGIAFFKTEGLPYSELSSKEKKVFDTHSQRVEEFCNRWGLRRNPIEIYTKTSEIKRAPILIGIDHWASFEDFKQLWSIIEKHQKGLVYGKQEIRYNFYRDLCWYDFKKHGLKEPKIAEIWVESHKEYVDKYEDKEYLQTTVNVPFIDAIRKAIERMQQQIEKLNK